MTGLVLSRRSGVLQRFYLTRTVEVSSFTKKPKWSAWSTNRICFKC